MMTIDIRPDLVIEPGSIPGPGGKVTIKFHAATNEINQIQAHYEILESSDYKWGPPPEEFGELRVVSNSVAKRTWPLLPQDGWYREEFAIEPTFNSKGSEAALKIAVTVVATKGKWQLDPVHAIGSVAVLTGTLRKLMGESEVPKGDAARAAFRARALSFVRQQIKALDANPEFKKKNFKWPVDETIVNALLGVTASRQSTIDALKPAIDFYKEKGLLKELKKADFLKSNGKIFKGIIKVSRSKPAP